MRLGFHGKALDPHHQREMGLSKLSSEASDEQIESLGGLLGVLVCAKVPRKCLWSSSATRSKAFVTFGGCSSRKGRIDGESWTILVVRGARGFC